MRGDAVSELLRLAEGFERNADQYTDEDLESRYLAGSHSALRRCAQAARDRAAELKDKWPESPGATPTT